MRQLYSRFGMVGALQSHDPVGHVLIGREELLPRNESGSGTEASIVTVATLSHDLFEAPCQNQNNLECPQLTDTINGSDNEVSHSVSQENAAPQSIELSRTISVPLTDDDLSNDAAVPPSTVPPHNVLPDPDRPQGYLPMEHTTDPRIGNFAISRHYQLLDVIGEGTYSIVW